MAQKSTASSPSARQSASATPAPDSVEATTNTHHTSGSSTPVVQASMNDPDAAANSNGSQPMTKSNSASSDTAAATARDSALAAAVAAGDGASPYGTRSRNRTGTSRPNYAEDKDIDAEMFDYVPDKKEKEADVKRPSRQGNQPAASTTAATASSTSVSQESSRANGSARRSLAGTADESKTGSSPNGVKEAAVASSTADKAAGAGVAGGSNPQPQAAAQPTKKRKAAPSSASASQPQTPAASSSNGAVTARRSAAGTRGGSFADSNMLSFETSNSMLNRHGALVADDGTVLVPNDMVYLVCEPPGEPYYLGRIMEFLHASNDTTKPIDALRINWFYRPKDIGRKTNDTRLVFATMHSDISPLTSLRGKCHIQHKAEIPRMDEHRKTPDCFWYEKLYDRYIQKNYDLIPTTQIVNVPEKVKKVLDERWRFVIVEQGRGKEFTSAMKLCKRCGGYCASNDSVDCAVCKNTYHMNCVRPPLLKKPSRGFAWSCAACSRAQERKLEARHTPNMAAGELDDDEVFDDDDDEMQGVDTGRTSPVDDDDSHRHGTAEQIYQASLWPWRYLGMHCRPEDALDYDDRIYPRASTRVGPRHQAPVLPWPGQPVEYLKPLEFKKNGKKDTKSKEALAAYEAEKARREKLPKWVQDAPPGYVARGGDGDGEETAELLYRPPPKDDKKHTDAAMDAYLEKALALAPKLDLDPRSTNLRDAAVETYFSTGYDEKLALARLTLLDTAAIKDPYLTPAEVKRFEDAVGKFGSELGAITRHVKSRHYGTIVRFYYMWKKTKNGRQIWGNFANRKGKKEAKKAEAAASRLQDDIADDVDDSAFDADKAAEKKKAFICKFCHVKHSRQWRRAPNASSAPVTENGGKNSQKEKASQYIQALCRRCAELWRRYAIQWEDLEEVAKKVAQAGGKAWKKRQDEEVLKELLSANEMRAIYGTPEPPAVSAPPAATAQTTGEPPRKKLKGGIPDKDSDAAFSDSGPVVIKKEKKTVEKPAPPPVPEIPKPKTMPCAICSEVEPLGDQHLSCKECRLTVHRNCYGVVDGRPSGKWSCDMCANDKNPQVSIHYKCVLCPHDRTEHDFVDAPKPSTKKKTEKEKERERSEREQAQKAAEFYRKKQEDSGRPVNPREALKRTADNNWVHVTCAIWTPEVKFENPKALGPSEGIPSIPRARYDEVCKACNHKGGACVACHHCKAPVHVECARQHGYLLGFDITPVKGSRRDQHSIVTVNGESGAMSATVWCKEHAPTKTVVHRMHSIVNEQGLNALQLYAQTCKQADLTLTGTVRKANLIQTAAKIIPASVTPAMRRASTTTMPQNGAAHEKHSETAPTHQPGEKLCITCGVDVTPRWWPIRTSDERELINGHYGSLGTEAQKFIEQRKFQCHKCHKMGRKPNSHPPREPSPQREVAQAAQPPQPASGLVAPQLRSPPLPQADSTRSNMSYPWGATASVAAVPPAHASPTAPHPMTPTAPAVQAPSMVPMHHGAMGAAPPPPPSGVLSYGASRYPDWPARPPTQHGSPPRQINGGPPPLQQVSIGNLSSLRPPPMAMSTAPPMPPVIPNGNHHGLPIHNGLPPSPRRIDGHPPPLGHASPYGHGYHHQQPPTHGLPNGAPPPPPIRGPDSFAMGLMSHRPPYPPHGGVQGGRDVVHGRDPREMPGPLSAPNMHPAEQPPRAAGASTSPSLRNLLS
ncbi:SANT domain-containing protein [Plectosphaerella plurivora]|uniref:SANT domain-containing protein n=1 Tax=Plectosphaerella plurivora TaxID=936078 RepID=A0A9P8VH86_9PEZI|nr:SANT domain-containing protein [Plectosphaerella plurivora]